MAVHVVMKSMIFSVIDGVIVSRLGIYRKSWFRFEMSIRTERGGWSKPHLEKVLNNLAPKELFHISFRSQSSECMRRICLNRELSVNLTANIPLILLLKDQKLEALSQRGSSLQLWGVCCAASQSKRRQDFMLGTHFCTAPEASPNCFD